MIICMVDSPLHFTAHGTREVAANKPPDNAEVVVQSWGVSGPKVIFLVGFSETLSKQSSQIFRTKGHLVIW